MGFLIGPLSRSGASESIDLPSLDRDELRSELKSIARLNRFFGGTSIILAQFDRFLKSRRLSGTVSILDVGTGGADIPRALVKFARKRGVRIEIVAYEKHEQVLEAAAGFSSAYPEISFVKADILTSSLAPASFDFAVCSLVAHHMSRDETVELLRILNHVSRRGFILSDLDRRRLAYAGVWLGTRLFTRSRYARHDGPLSVLRAYTLDEMTELTRRAGCDGLRIFRHPFFRLLVVQEKNGFLSRSPGARE